MNPSSAPVTIVFRIPGQWSNPQDLIRRLPKECRLTPETLTMPDGTEVEFGAMAPDNQFAQIFRTSCRKPASDDELKTVNGYTVNITLSGLGGSMVAARKMMQAAAAIIRAGGAGVFIDNSGLAHGGKLWLEMTEDGGPDALSFAYVTIVGGKADVWTMGMHALGLRDIFIKREDIDKSGLDIIDIIRYLCQAEKPIDDGHVLADLGGLRFQAFTQDSPKELAGSPMYNPFGRLKLVSMRDVAESN